MKLPRTSTTRLSSTDKQRRKESITVSNLKRLATDPGPSFIVFIEFGREDDPKDAYIVHIDEQWIPKILKRVQERNNPFSVGKKKKKKKLKKGKRGPKKKQQVGPALNKTTISVKYDESNRLNQPNGQSLKAAIEAAVPHNMQKYIEDKKRHLESTGFEDGYGTVKFSVEGEQDISGLIDLSLGLKDSLKVKDPIFTPKRFGIVTEKDVSQGATGWISMPDLQPMSKGLLKFSDSKTIAPLVFEVDVYSSPFNAKSHRDFVKIRIVASHFEVHLHPFIGKFQANFSIDGPIEIRLLNNILQLMLLLENTEQGTNMVLCIEGFPDLTFRHGEKDSRGKFSINTADFAKAAKAAKALIAEFEITETVDATLDELEKEALKLQGMARIFAPGEKHWHSGFDDDGLEPDSDKKTAVACFFSVRIGEFTAGLFVVTLGTPKKVDGGYRLETPEFRLEGRMVSERGKAFDSDKQIRLLQQIVDRYQDDHQLRITCDEEVFKRLQFKEEG